VAQTTVRARDSSQEIFIGPGVYMRTTHRAEFRPAANVGTGGASRNARGVLRRRR